jgi:hypothetical protein
VVEEGQGIMEDRGKGSDYLVGRNLGEDASKEHLVAEEVVEGDRIVRNEDQIDEIGFAVEVAAEPSLNVDWDLNLWAVSVDDHLDRCYDGSFALEGR